MNNLPSTIQLIKKHGIIANKIFGQNFITNQSLTDKIVRAAGDISDKQIIEIGPGPGCLTRSIMDAAPQKFSIIEKDAKLKPLLDEINSAYDDKINFIHEDCLELNYEQFANDKTYLIANLPYNIATEIITRIVKQYPFITKLIVMVQKEVAERIVAKAGDKKYGRLASFINLYADTKYLFTVNKSAFTPPPKVQSAIVEISRLEKLRYDVDPNKFEALNKQAFATRRKTLRNSLIKTIPNIEEILEELNIDKNIRAEKLPLADLCRLVSLI